MESSGVNESATESTSDVPQVNCTDTDGALADAELLALTPEQVRSLSKDDRKRRKVALKEEKRKHLMEKRRLVKKRRVPLYQQKREPWQRRERADLRALPHEERKYHLVFDMGFNHLMKPGELVSIANQVRHSYGEIRKSLVCPYVHITSIDDDLQKVIDTFQGHENWVAERTEKVLTEVIPRDKCVYLSAESNEVLSELEDGCHYIIGGLVDRNRFKGISRKRAAELGVRTARLPLQEHVDMSAGCVMTTLHVVKILLCFMSTGSWEQACQFAVPQRKRRREEEEKSSDEDASESAAPNAKQQRAD